MEDTSHVPCYVFGRNHFKGEHVFNTFGQGLQTTNIPERLMLEACPIMESGNRPLNHAIRGFNQMVVPS
jgi:hypothetical protein